LQPKSYFTNDENPPFWGLHNDLDAFAAYKRQILVGSNPPCNEYWWSQESMLHDLSLNYHFEATTPHAEAMMLRSEVFDALFRKKRMVAIG